MNLLPMFAFMDWVKDMPVWWWGALVVLVALVIFFFWYRKRQV